MHLKLILSLILVILINASCKKSAAEKEVVKPKKLLSKIIETSIGQSGNSTIFTDFSYDEEGRLIKEKQSGSEINYTYKSKELFQVVHQTASAKITVEFVYESGRVKTATIVDKRGSIVNEMIMKYFYQGDKILRVDRVKDGVVNTKMDYQYIGTEVSKTTEDDGTTIVSIEYVSDDKKNVHYDLGAQMLEALACLNYKAPTTHNFLKETTFFGTHDSSTRTSVEVNNTYQYDEDGYPRTLIKTSKHSSQPVGSEKRYTFEYKLL